MPELPVEIANRLEPEKAEMLRDFREAIIVGKPKTDEFSEFYLDIVRRAPESSFVTHPCIFRYILNNLQYFEAPLQAIRHLLAAGFVAEFFSVERDDVPVTRSLLFFDALLAKPEWVREIVRHYSIDVNQRTMHDTPLTTCCYWGLYDTAKVLIEEFGADPLADNLAFYVFNGLVKHQSTDRKRHEKAKEFCEYLIEAYDYPESVTQPSIQYAAFILYEASLAWYRQYLDILVKLGAKPLKAGFKKKLVRKFSSSPNSAFNPPVK